MPRPLYHAVCHTCASDDEARESLNVQRFDHETLTRNEAFAKMAVTGHRGHGHRAEYARVR